MDLDSPLLASREAREERTPPLLTVQSLTSSVASQTSPARWSHFEEMVARRWLKSKGLYMASCQRVVNVYFHHLIACLKQPRGLADGASTGSQQCCFTLELADEAAAEPIFEGFGGEHRRDSRFDTEKEVWCPATGVRTFYEADHERLTKFLDLGSRWPSMDVEGASKLAPPPQGHLVSKVVIRALTPFIAEVTARSHGRLTIETTFNVMTVNDLNGIKMPPLFEYAPGQREVFRRLALVDVFNMTRRSTTSDISAELQSLAMTAANSTTG